MFLKKVYVFHGKLDKIGTLSISDECSKKFKLNLKRSIAIALIESGEYLKKIDRFELDEFDVDSQKTNDAMKTIFSISLRM